MKHKRIYRRGDIYLVDLGAHYGSEQGGCRPVLLIQNNVGNYYGPTLIVAPITSRYTKKVNQPTHYVLMGVDTLPSPSMVLAEQILTIDKSRVIKPLGKVSVEQMKNIDKAIMVSLGLYP
ncbi:MAG: type II toxin-antitoxin system PemK/MazF family toxin [Bacillota bacterium]|nr:type II toxin-antitoxin system PemK/MazF family toxin [Bacillota bacterium]